MATPTNGAPTPQLADKMRELTLSVGRVMKAKATVAHRRKQSNGVQFTWQVDEGSPQTPSVEPREHLVDEYGFAVLLTAKQAEAIRRCSTYADKQATKWAAWPQSCGQLPPEERLKKLCRKGVPPQLRKWVWMEISGAAARQKAAPAGYFRMAIEEGRTTSPFVHQINLDVPRTFPNCAWVQSEPGQASIRRVLLAFAHHNPRVGYCQGMNYVAALLLLALGHDEEEAFWVLASLIDDDRGILYQDMYADGLAGCHVEMRSLGELVEAKLPRLAAHMAALRCDMSLLATDWFLCLYSTSLPSETVARVWDSLLLEGPKVLFRVALALLKMHEPALLVTDNPGDLMRVVRNAAAEEYDRDELMHVAFDGVGGLPMDRIRRYRDRNQRKVDMEFAAREMRANLRVAVEEHGYVMTPREADLLKEQERAKSKCGDEGSWMGSTAWRSGLHGLAGAVGGVKKVAGLQAGKLLSKARPVGE
jgi:TBC1 domain family member 2A